MDSWLVVGLGNPGPTYANHRHNIGFLVTEELARRAGAGFTAPKGLRADVCETRVGEHGIGSVGAQAQRVVLMKSRSFMNDTGGPVGKVAAYFHATPAQTIVVHDELDLDFGRMRVKLGGGDNGHNGLKSIRKSFDTGDFFRVRCGIGRPPGRQVPADFVLSNFPAAAREELQLEVGLAADAVECLIAEGLAATQNRFNS